ncbi:NDP-sugar synthase [Prosthecochloris sp. HL-130-GSB]|jgi:mannose-1-phosphate guanylyltransferase|uniref:nucleotidyltransferase family protein n=1 Tax=Prosthecochloris sp. HL-130-GSB TaxID=1974213 RepID=UPI000A1C14CE|nr:NDP-sugar synthase [Prosthecochloris sp. HL-130-GSB]ARM30170.1 nucleotidyl transferase [Prosthecochloris sp. HL-130-GSB]MBO8091764.1 NDP-sugar synthase [Prosthecochloris sp.]
MKAFVLAAGFGTRLRPLTHRIPKPLIPVLNLPALCYTLFLLKEAGIQDIICNVHYHASLIRGFLDRNNHFGLSITISEEPEILGTGGGLKKCEPLLSGDDFLLINSDIIADFDLSAFISHFRQSNAPGDLMLFSTPAARRIGHVGVSGGKILDFANRFKTGLESDYIYTGAALLRPEIFTYLEHRFSSIVDTGFAGLMNHGGLAFFRHNGFWHDIGTPSGLWDLSIRHHDHITALADRMQKSIGRAPCMIAPGSEIHHGAKVVSSVVGNECIIERGARVERCILMPGTVIGKHETVTDSIVCTEGRIDITS